MGEWISLKDRRPTMTEMKKRGASTVLVATTAGTVKEANWGVVVKMWETSLGSSEPCFYTDWMHMPAHPRAPKEKT